MKIAKLKSPTLVAGAGLAVGLLADLLFYDRPIGISFPIVMAVCVVAMVAVAIAGKTKITWANLWLVGPLLYLAIMSAVRAAPFLRFLNIAGTLLLLALFADRLTSEPAIRLNFGGYFVNLLKTSIYSALIPPALIGKSVRELQSEGERTSQARRALVGLVVAAPFLLVFTVLFASADLLFDRILEDLIGDFTIGDVVGHTLLTGLLAWIVMGGLAYALTRNDGDAENDSGEATARQSFKIQGSLGTTEVAVALFSIDALFLLFVGIQFAALFGGETFLEQQGLTYSEYARQGFFELLAVGIITLGLILGLDFISRRETRRQRTSFLLGSGLMVVLTLIILVSAFQRLRLYELAFGFTRLRVHAHALMAWLGVLFAVFLVMLFIRRTRLFATASVVVAVCFTASLNILNPDAFIVRQNLTRFRAGEELDVEYLGTLSADAVPHLTPLLSEGRDDVGDRVGPWLHMHLIRLESRENRAGWPSAHTSLDRAYVALDGERGVVENYEPAYSMRFD